MGGASVIAALLTRFAGKIGIEMTMGSTIFPDNIAGSYTLVPLAHALERCVGLACTLTGSTRHNRD